MELFFEKKIHHNAFHIAVSLDGLKVAVSSDQKITIFSTPDYQRTAIIPVQHTSSMIFLKDSNKLLILNTHGKLFFWNGEKATKLGKWPVPRWAEAPLFYSGDRYAFWTLDGNVWRYDIDRQELLRIYSSPKDLVICKCANGLLSLIGYQYNLQEQLLTMLTMDYDGQISHIQCTHSPIETCYVGKPCWTDDGVVVVSVVATPSVSGDSHPKSILYLIDSTTGSIITKKEYLGQAESIDCYYGNGMIAKVFPVFSCRVEIYEAKSLTDLFVVDSKLLTPNGKTNPPTEVCFTSNKKVFIGSWNNVCVFTSSIPETDAIY